MIKFYLYIIIFLFSSALFAQPAENKTDASGKKQGKWIKLDANKKKLYEGTFVNDVPVGKFIYYYDNEVIYSEIIWSDNGKVGRAKLYNGAGKLTAQGKYVNEKKDSVWVFYNQEGKLLADDSYKMGKKHGVCRVYYNNGQIAEEKNWKDGVLHGSCKKYFEGGEQKYTGQYVNGKVEGKVIYYHINGKINATGVYKDDVKEGEWKYFDEKGTQYQKDVYVKGRLMSSDKPDSISKEQQDEEKKKFEQLQLKDPFEDR